ncbi:hypothetical protein Bca101_100792 [Brassica carinata]
MSSLFSLFKKKVFEAMVVSPGRSFSLQSIKGVSQLCAKLKPFKKKAFILFLKLETWSCEERWNLLCCGVKEEVMNTRRRCWVTIQLSYPLDSWPVTKEAQGTSSGSQEVFLVHHPSELKEEDFAHCVEQWRVEKEVVMRHWCEVSLKLTCKLGPILNPSLRRGLYGVSRQESVQSTLGYHEAIHPSLFLANLTSRESLYNVWARFESYKSGPSLVDKAGLGCKDKGSHDHEPGLICGQIRRSLRRANHSPAFPILN